MEAFYKNFNRFVTVRGNNFGAGDIFNLISLDFHGIYTNEAYYNNCNRGRQNPDCLIFIIAFIR